MFLPSFSLTIGAASWQNQQNDMCAQQRLRTAWSSAQYDQSLRMKKAWVRSYPLSAKRRPWSDWADAQDELSLRWAHMPFCWFCHEAAHFCLYAKHQQDSNMMISRTADKSRPSGKPSVINLDLPDDYSVASKSEITVGKTNEPRHDKADKLTCAPSEDSDQPGHPTSLIRVVAVRMKKPWVLGYPLSAQRRLWSEWADA